MYNETLKHYSRIHRGQFPLGEDRFINYGFLNPRLLFDEHNPASGVIDSFRKVFDANPVIVEGRKESIARVRARQNFIRRHLPLKGKDLSDSNVFSFEYGNFGYVISLGSHNFPNDYLHIIQIAKFREMSYYRIDFEVFDFGKDVQSENGPAEVEYKLYRTEDDYIHHQPTLEAANKSSAMQVAVKLLSNLKHKRFGVNYSFSYT